MDALTILALVARGLSYAKLAWDNRDLAFTAINAVTGIIEKHKSGTLTQADLDATEAELDALFAEFNAPLPSDGAGLTP